MPATFEELVNELAYFAIVFIVVEVYLTVNKLWKRKHERVVAESISLTARFVSLFPMTVFTIHAYTTDNWQNFTYNGLIVFLILVHISVGSGFWVAGQQRKSFWKLVKQSLSMEQKEVGDLAKSFFRPSQADKLLSILEQVAFIDNDLDDKEIQFINSFAKHWNIDIDWKSVSLSMSNTSINFDSLRKAMTDYLSTSPPQAQVLQFIDVLTMLVNIDGNIADNEAFMLEELTGLAHSYTQQKVNTTSFYVAIIPQNKAQEDAVLVLTPPLRKNEAPGGYAYVAGPFYSQRYADIVADEYRTFNLFSATLREDQLKI
ncbi:MAG: TerB family tellurite resistance protein [Cytophagales bacterium]|nr:MAG: TerB family tellurite resistance protein [Cytophagales bacterium]TAF61318.1 MAG: TerB family tellurite resistance protein [Cytophagales bacterium]